MNFDDQHVWHPYAKIPNAVPTYLVESADNVYLNLEGGRRVIDGMSSWWSMIHGYNNPALNQAIKAQIDRVSHVMFGGLTHQPAIDLCELLVQITPSDLDKVFLADSGSVSVEISLKMALQYWYNKGRIDKTHFVTPRGGYHGDTFGAMSVCDPENGMHQLFQSVLPKHYFVTKPIIGNTSKALTDLSKVLEESHNKIAAMILEPIVQGAGGMNIYDPEYLKEVRSLCDTFDVLLIVDEIATGFGRTGKLFGCEHANISPDILCLGKALTGGYMTMAAMTFTPDEFKVGVNIFGVTNWLRTLKSIPPYWESFRNALYKELGDPTTADSVRLYEISPVFHAHKVKNPVMVLQGANDPRVLKIESDEIVAGIEANGITVEYVVFDDEGHGFRKKENEIEGYGKVLTFLETYLKGKG